MLGGLGPAPVAAQMIVDRNPLHVAIPGISLSGASGTPGMAAADFPSIFGRGRPTSTGVGAQAADLCVRLPQATRHPHRAASRPRGAPTAMGCGETFSGFVQIGVVSGGPAGCPSAEGDAGAFTRLSRPSVNAFIRNASA